MSVPETDNTNGGGYIISQFPTTNGKDYKFPKLKKKKRNHQFFPKTMTSRGL